MNTRKIYFPKNNISEKSLIHPQDQYAKNKLITENYLIKKYQKEFKISYSSSNIIEEEFTIIVDSLINYFSTIFYCIKNKIVL